MKEYFEIVCLPICLSVPGGAVLGISGYLFAAFFLLVSSLGDPLGEDFGFVPLLLSFLSPGSTQVHFSDSFSLTHWIEMFGTVAQVDPGPDFKI